VSTSHIFIAEDDPDVRTSIAEILRDEGYEVGEFANLDDVLVELRGGARPCVVLTDYLMPGMNGQEFLETVRHESALSKIPVVVITGSRAVTAEVEVLRKPFDLCDLVAVVARHCEHASRAERGPSEPAPHSPVA
jgi:DNA-binding NtrC family response regulator